MVSIMNTVNHSNTNRLAELREEMAREQAIASEAFENAIAKGYFVREESEATLLRHSDGTKVSDGMTTYVGEWMYMHAHKNGDFFKNKITRRYIVVPPVPNPLFGRIAIEQRRPWHS